MTAARECAGLQRNPAGARRMTDGNAVGQHPRKYAVLSLFAALFGVFYTAIVVSVFVGLAQSAKGGARGNE